MILKALARWAKARPPRVWFGDGVILGSLSLFAVDAYFNWSFNSQMATTPGGRIALGIAGIAIAGTLAMLAIGRRFLDPEHQAGAKRKAFVLIALLAGWGVWSAMGQISTHRGDSVGSRVHEKATFVNANDELARARADLAKIPAGRTPGQIAADMQQIEAKPYFAETKACTSSGGYANTCRRYIGYKGELATAQERTRLSQRVEALTNATASASGAVEADADPQAKAAETVASILGFSVHGDTFARLAPVMLSIILLLSGWWGIDLGFLIRGIEFGSETSAKTANDNVLSFRASPNTTHTQTIVVDNRDPKVMAAIEALTRKAS
jgi:hypothetical protein